MADSAFEQIISIIRAECGEEPSRRAILRLVDALGGERVYVPVRVRLEPVVIDPQDVPRTVQVKEKVSRSTAWRWTKKFRI